MRPQLFDAVVYCRFLSVINCARLSQFYSVEDFYLRLKIGEREKSKSLFNGDLPTINKG